MKPVLAKAPAGAVRRILAVYRRAEPETRADGLVWYQRAHELCGDIAAWDGLSVAATARVVAVLSPSVGWRQNVRDASQLCAWWANGKKGPAPVVATYRQNRNKALQVLEGDYAAVRGQKVTAFATLLLDPSNTDVVCVDGHAYRIAHGLRETSNKQIPVITEKRYRDTAAAYRRAAKLAGVTPAQIQAVTWLQWRKELGGLEHHN